MKKAAPSAASWGCLSSTFSCLCENRWFADGYNSCVRQSCGFTDTYDAKSQFETQCNSTFTRGQQRVVEGRRLTLLPELLQRDLVSYKVTETTFVPAVDTNPPNAFTLLPADPASTPLPISAVAQMTTTPVSIPFTTSALGTPSSSPIFSSTSITAAPSTQTSPPATGGVSQSAKIVVGLGVPLAIPPSPDCIRAVSLSQNQTEVTRKPCGQHCNHRTEPGRRQCRSGEEKVCSRRSSTAKIQGR